jgi:hypothetical protein
MWSARGLILAVSVSLGSSGAAASDKLSACLARCDRARLSETNRATCRLDCEQDAATDPERVRAQIRETRAAARTPEVAPRAASSRLNERAECEARCTSATDRAACERACAPAAATKGASGGARASVTLGLGPAPSSFLAMCLRTCDQGQMKSRAHDQARCRLTCESTASVLDVALDAAPTGWLATAPPPMVLASSRPASPAKKPAAASTSPARPSQSAAGGSCEAARARCEGACDKVRAACERGCGKQKIETHRARAVQAAGARAAGRLVVEENV